MEHVTRGPSHRPSRHAVARRDLLIAAGLGVTEPAWVPAIRWAGAVPRTDRR